MMNTSISKVMLALYLVFALTLTSATQAREFRSIFRIQTPTVKLPPGTEPVVPVRPIRQAVIRAELEKFFAATIDPELEKMLADSFPNKRQVLDELQTTLPKSTKVTMQSFRSPHTLRQRTISDKDGKGFRMISTVSVVVTTQTQFHNPGLTTLTNEFEIVMDVDQHFPYPIESAFPERAKTKSKIETIR